jgi:hypothetical protein
MHRDTFWKICSVEHVTTSVGWLLKNDPVINKVINPVIDNLPVNF